MKSNKILSIVGGVLLVGAGQQMNMRCEMLKARQEAQQAKFQKVLVLKSKAYDKSKTQDRIKQ